MIISHKLKVIFIKPLKAGGTSFQQALLKYCDYDDVCISDEPAPKFKNYFNGRCFEDEHITSEDLRGAIPQDIWDNYLKVSIVRCPYDALISSYYYDYYLIKKRGVNNGLFYKDFDTYTACRFYADSYLMLCINNRSAMDYIIRYENFEEDIKSLEIKIGCEGLLETYRNYSYKRHIRPPGHDIYAVYSKHPLAAAIIEKRLTDSMQNELIQKYCPLYKKRLYEGIKEPGYFSKKMAEPLCRHPVRYSIILGYLRLRKPLIRVKPLPS